MRHLTAVEHGWLEIGEGRDLSAHEAEALGAIENLLPWGCLQWGYRRVKFAQFCGVVQADGLQVEVLPKLTPYQNKQQQRTILVTMLACANDLEGIEALSTGLATTHNTLLNLFIRHFARLLEHELQQGLLRDYRDVDDTLDRVRGRIDLVRQQRENLFKPQRMACRYSELIADISVNRLLHSALQLVSRLCDSPPLAQQLHALRMRFADIGTLSPHERGPSADQLDRMQKRYSRVVDLAHQFLDGQFLDARSGRQRAFSLLFDMNRLFERYTASRLRPLARQHGLQLVEQGPRRHLGHEESGQGRLLMRPDISLLDDQKRPIIIFDTKWKRLEGNNPLAVLSATDLYQIGSYATAYGCKTVGLLYPEQEQLSAGKPHTLTLADQRKTRLIVNAVRIDGQNLSDHLIEHETLSI